MSTYGQDQGLSLLVARGVNAVERPQISRIGRAVISETLPMTMVVGSLAIVGGIVYYVALGLLAGDVISNVVTYVGNAGVGMTLCKSGLYDTGGHLLASSADQGTSWETVGLKTAPMLSPYTVPVSGAYYVAVVANSSGTKPTLLRGSSSLIIPALSIGSGIPAFCGQTGQADFPNPGTLTGGVTANGYWMAVT